MRQIKILWIFIIILFFVCTLAAQTSLAQSNTDSHLYVDHLLIKLKTNNAEKEMLDQIDGLLVERMSKNLLLVKVTNFTVEQAQKILSGRPDIESITPDYYLKQSVDKSVASHVDLWNLSAQMDASVAAALQSVNNRVPGAKIAYIDVHNRSDEINAEKKEIFVKNLSDTDSSPDEGNLADTTFLYGIISDESKNSNLSDLIRALKWADIKNANIVGFNVYTDSHNEILKETLENLTNSNVLVVHFRNKTNKSDLSFTEYYKQNLIDISIEEKKPEVKQALVTPNLLPVPTIPVAAGGLTFNLPTLEVDNLLMKLIQSGEYRDVKISVKIKGTQQNQNISGAKVIVDLSTPNGKIFTGTDITNSDGMCEFILRNITNAGRYSVNITGLEKNGYTISTRSNSSATIDVI